MTSTHPSLIERLHAVVGDAGLVLDAERQAAYLTDWPRKWTGRTPVVVRPNSTEETAAVMRLCHQTRTPVVPQGGNTGMTGAGIPDMDGAQIIVSMNRMNRILEVDATSNTMTVEAGVILASVQQAAADANRFFPLSLGAEGSCTIGGNLATNAGGISVLRYGNARDLALGVEVVLADGRVWDGLRALRKDNSGYDLRNLFIGSEGTLGVITRAVLKLFPAQHGRATAWVGLRSHKEAVALLSLTQSICGDRIIAFEMMSEFGMSMILRHVADTQRPLSGVHPYYVLIELADAQQELPGTLLEEALAAALEAGLADDAVLAVNDRQRQQFWKIREGVSQAQLREGHPLKHDIALPIARLVSFIDEANALIAASFPQLPVLNFGHIGDGNLHYNVLLPHGLADDERERLTAEVNLCIHDLAIAYRGSISAEHGVGRLRRDELRRYKSAVEKDLMRSIKATLDPDQLLNPGKVL
ncbi:2-hydroxyacid dehydrogenase [Caballeronia mineralivorans PML1(12)]|uniref:2-hydroxyacid dehydrogenase n=1 Tax=Caballeronia mineralivorans PML1(12) TaxID=908627 RepID=A0A0J1CWZ9_9BURK|nr:FAD-binding oxidoreductase [Caballeronia mineralivorans]KLU25100.1 2-hydroxyacid dehydrogenase [Caballeronia mineralivorans PML1(12)]